MWAYCMAAAHLGLRHEQLDHYMISTWGAGESHRWLNKWTGLGQCSDPRPQKPEDQSPPFIHLASNFKAPSSKEWMFHKGHVPADILDCDVPFIIESPDDVFDVSREVKTKTSAWVMCHAVHY